MTEAEVVEQLVEFTQILLAGVSVYFTVVSAYVAALNYFIGSANVWARLLAYLFFSVVIGMLVVALFGAVMMHTALIERLKELAALGELSAAGKGALANSVGRSFSVQGTTMSIDATVQAICYSVLGLTFLVTFYMTFFWRWTPDHLQHDQHRMPLA